MKNNIQKREKEFIDFLSKNKLPSKLYAFKICENLFTYSDNQKTRE